MMAVSLANPPPAPYIGPRTFDISERRFFCGRDNETDILTSLVMAHRVSLFFAQSGAGKSSLLRAGLIPKVTRKKQIGWGDRARLSQMMAVFPILTVGKAIPPQLNRPIGNIFVFSSLLGLLEQTDPNELASLTLAEGLARRLEAAQPAEDEPEAGEQARLRLEKPEISLLIFDQFEELFTRYIERWPEREGFFQQVNQALGQDPDLHVLFTVREDYIAQLTPYAPLLPEQLRHRFRLERLQQEAATQAVKLPAQRATPSREFALGVVEGLVDNLRRIQLKQATERPQMGDGQNTVALGEYIEPVHLQIVCRQLWEQLPAEQTTIYTEDVQKFGDVDEALIDFYEDTLQKVVKETTISERTLREWFGPPLITSAGTRGLVYRGETETERLPNAAVDILNNAYIIRAEIRGSDIWYELAHDRLVEPIQDSNARWREANHSPSQSRVAEEIFRIADDLYQKHQIGNEDVISSLLLQAIKIYPQHVQANQLLAKVYLLKEDPLEAQKVLENLSKDEPAAAHPLLVETLLTRAKKTTDHIAQAQLLIGVLELEPNQPDALAKRPDLVQTLLTQANKANNNKAKRLELWGLIMKLEPNQPEATKGVQDIREQWEKHLKSALLPAWDPRIYLRLLYWIIWAPDSFFLYRLWANDNEKKRLRWVNSWLASTLAWLLLLLFILTLWPKTLPYYIIPGDLLGSGLILAWILTGRFGDREKVWLAIAALVVTLGMVSVVTYSVNVSTWHVLLMFGVAPFVAAIVMVSMRDTLVAGVMLGVMFGLTAGPIFREPPSQSSDPPPLVFFFLCLWAVQFLVTGFVAQSVRESLTTGHPGWRVRGYLGLLILLLLAFGAGYAF